MRQFLKNFALIAIGLIAGVAATIQLSATAQQGGQLPLDELRTLSNVFRSEEHTSELQSH